MSVRILLADDHCMFREGLREVLSDEAEISVVAEASDGRMAVRMAHELAPDVVIMDIGMRDLNGTEATRQIVAANREVKVVALSTYSDKVHVLDVLEAGAVGYVIKSAAFDELRRAVRAAVEGLIFLSPEVAGFVVEARLAPHEGAEVEKRKSLSPREREILQLISEGYTSVGIAEKLFIAPATVDTHRRNIARKVGRHSIAELTKYAIQVGLTEVDF